MSHQPLTDQHAIEMVALDQIHAHARNYQTHPDDELEHIMMSIRTHGLYRPLVICQDGTLLAGHGVAEAARRLGYKHVPVIRLKYDSDDPRALKLLVGDNEIRHLAEVDDRALTDLLRDLHEGDDDLAGLLGTGYDEMMLANLAMVTRPASEIADFDAAAQWVGLPEYDEEGEHRIQIMVNFVNEDHRMEFCHLLGLDTRATGKAIWWPEQPEKNDVKSIRFLSEDEGNGDDD